MINGQTLEQEVNEPKHYRSHESGIEAIEITRWLQYAWRIPEESGRLQSIGLQRVRHD